MYTCKETVKMLSSGEKLTLRQRLEVRAHMFICRHCTSYFKQLNAIKAQLKKVYSKISSIEPDRVSHLEQKILQKIKNGNDSLD